MARELRTMVPDDLRLAIRAILFQPRLALFVCLTLAIAIAAATVIFTFVNALVLGPLPMAEPNRVVLIFTTHASQGIGRGGVSLPDLLDWRSRATALDHIAAAEAASTAGLQAGGAGGPVAVRVRRVTGNFARAWALVPAAGRLPADADDEPGAPCVAALSHGFWTREFAEEPGVIGRAIHLGGEPCRIVGVMPRELEIGDLALTDIWTPLRGDALTWPRGRRTLQATALLRAGATAASADAELRTIQAGVAAANPESEAGWSTRVQLFKDAMAVPETWTALGLAAVAVALVLLVACANIASLMLARAIDRRRETAIRLALGASPIQIVRPLLVEAILVSFVAAGAGLLLACVGLDVVRAVTFHPFFRQQVTIDHRVLAFVLGTAFLTPLVFGLGPSISACQGPLQPPLQAAGSSLVGGSRRAVRARALLVAAQLAGALALLIVCVLSVEAAVRLQRRDPGFDTSRLLVVRVDLPERVYGGPDQVAAFHHRALDGLARLPGVGAAAATSRLPLIDPPPLVSIALSGRSPLEDGLPWCTVASVSPGYFKALGIAVRAGRTFAAADNGLAPGVAVVNEEAAARYWAGAGRAIGALLHLDLDGARRDLRVVGVVANVRGSPDEKAPRPELYVPLAQSPARAVSYLVETGAPAQLARPVRAVLRAADPSLATSDARSFDEMMRDRFADDRLVAGLFASFAIVALVLAAIGVYALIQYSVTRRAPEIAVRMVLGATPGDVARLALSQAVRLALAGAVAGTLLGYALAQMVRHSVRGVDAVPIPLVAGAAALLIVVAVAAALFPAGRVMRIDPAAAMRNE